MMFGLPKMEYTRVRTAVSAAATQFCGIGTPTIY